MNKTIFSTVGAAVLASLCCIGPIVMIVLGSTSIGYFSIFEPIRPVFTVLAIGILIYAYFKLFRKEKASCCETIDSKKPLRRQKFFLMGMTPVIIALIAFPYFAESLHAGDYHAHNGYQSEWVIEGMTCSGCAMGMEGALSAAKGMNGCNVNFEKGSMVCFTDKDELSLDEISSLVEGNGYKAIQKTNHDALN